VDLEFAIKLPQEAGRAHGNVFSNHNEPSLLLWFWIDRWLVPAYFPQEKQENGCGCNDPRMLQAFVVNQLRSRIASDKKTHDEWSRSGA
jgi:hypothetical protein